VPSTRTANANSGRRLLQELRGGRHFLPLLLCIALGDAAGQPLIDLFFEISSGVLAQGDRQWERAGLLEPANVLLGERDILLGFQLRES
jgi:hypothetical protein